MNDTPRCEPPLEHRDRDGWHWLVWTPKGETEPYNPTAIWWDSTVQDWCPDLPNTDAPRVLAQYRYLSPVATPAEVAALRAERDAAVQRADKADAAAVGKAGRLAVDMLRARVAEAEAEAERDAAVAAADAANDAIAGCIEQLTTIRARVAELEAALRALFDAGVIPKSSAKEGGAMRFSSQVAAADIARAALGGTDG